MGCTAHHDVDRDTSEFQISIFLSNFIFVTILQAGARRVPYTGFTFGLHGTLVHLSMGLSPRVWFGLSHPFGTEEPFSTLVSHEARTPLSYSSPPLPKPSRIDYRRTYSSLDSSTPI